LAAGGVAGVVIAGDEVVPLVGAVECPANTKYAMTISATTIIPPMTQPTAALFLLSYSVWRDPLVL
jgi:hypothetical protein